MILWLLVTSQTTVIMSKPSPTCYKQPRSVMWNSSMTSFNTSKMKWNVLERKIIPKTVASPVKIVSVITAMSSPTNKNQVQSFIGMINYLSKLSPRLSELTEPIREISKDKVLFNWGPEHQHTFTEMDKEIASAPVLTYYNPKTANYFADRCQCQRSWCLFTTRWQTSIFCKQGSYQCPERLCSNWIRITCSGLSNGEIPSFSICQSFSTRNWQETTWSHII